MQIQKMFFLANELDDAQVSEHFRKRVAPDKSELFAKWPEVSPDFSFQQAASRNCSAGNAWLVRTEIDERVFAKLLTGFSADDARFIFVGSLLEHGWETVPAAQDVAYLYGEFSDGNLQSVLKYDGEIRRYRMREQLMPNINRRFTRFVILFPDLISFIEEANSNFPRQCYIISEVVERVARRSEDVQILGELNGVPLKDMDDRIRLMEKIGGERIRLSDGHYQLEPLDWPILRADRTVAGGG